MKKAQISLVLSFLIWGTTFLFAQSPKPEQDCINAIPVCNTVYTFPTPYLGAGNLPNEISNSINCILSEESNSVWFKMDVLTGGKINLTITPKQIQDDYDWSVFNLTNATCADIAKISSLSVSCNNSQMGLPPGITGTTIGSGQNQGDQHSSPFNAPISALAGETYLLVVTSSQPTDGFQIDFTKSTAIFGSLPFQFSATSVDCASDSIVLSASKNIMCSSIAADGSDFIVVDGDGNIYPVTMSKGKSCSAGLTTRDVVIKFTGHPGKNTTFTIKVKKGTDGNTLQDECGGFIADGATLATINAISGAIPFQFTATDVSCNHDSMTITASRNIVCSSIAGDGSDFLITDAEGNTYNTSMGKGKTCSSGALTKDVLIKFIGYPLNSAAFTIHAKKGTDGNTLKDECGNFIAEGTKLTLVNTEKCPADIPNVITPNNDGTNDTFKITGNDGVSKLKIFNRWGEIVFETSTYKNDWDGGNASAGVYYYIYEMPNGKSKTGTLTIIR